MTTDRSTRPVPRMAAWAPMADGARAVRRAARVLALLWGLLLAMPWARAQDVQPVPPLTGRVVDLAGVLSPADREALTAQLAGVEASRGSQLVVLVVRTTAPEDIAAYAQRIGDAWKIGRREVGDGLLIVVAVDDRRVNIQVAKALEGAVPDLAARQIIVGQITPAFRAGDYAGGLRAAVTALDRRIGGEGLPVPPDRPAGAAGGSAGPDLEDLAIFLFVGVPIVGSVLTAVFGRRLGSLLTGGAAGAAGWWLTASVLVAAGAGLAALVLVGLFGIGARRRGGFGGRGGPVIWGGGHHGGGWSGGGGGFGGGGGGFSSGGGGDFGGGGASGSW